MTSVTEGYGTIASIFFDSPDFRHLFSCSRAELNSLRLYFVIVRIMNYSFDTEFGGKVYYLYAFLI